MKNLRKTILYIGGFELPDFNAAAHRVIANGKILNEIDYDVIYFGISHTMPYCKNILNTRKNEQGICSYKIGYPKSIYDWINHLTSISYIKKIIKLHNIDKVIAYNYPAIALWKLYKYGRKTGISIIADCTEWYVPKGKILFKVLKGGDSFLRMRVIQPKLDGIITISKYLFEYYTKRNSNVIFIPPLVDKQDVKWKKKDNSDESYCRLVYAGSGLDGQKDHLGKLISALKKIKKRYKTEFILDIVGITYEQYQNNFGKLYSITDLNIFNFHGRKSNHQTIEKIKKSDFSIFIREDNLVNRAGFPTKFVESISCGTPVLTNNTSNILDYLINGKNGYILDISSDEMLVQSLYKAITTGKKSIKMMKKNCNEYQRFDYREYKDEFRGLLNYIMVLSEK